MDIFWSSLSVSAHCCIHLLRVCWSPALSIQLCRKSQMKLCSLCGWAYGRNWMILGFSWYNGRFPISGSHHAGLQSHVCSIDGDWRSVWAKDNCHLHRCCSHTIFGNESGVVNHSELAENLHQNTWQRDPTQVNRKHWEKSSETGWSVYKSSRMGHYDHPRHISSRVAHQPSGAGHYSSGANQNQSSSGANQNQIWLSKKLEPAVVDGQ